MSNPQTEPTSTMTAQAQTDTHALWFVPELQLQIIEYLNWQEIWTASLVCWSWSNQAMSIGWRRASLAQLLTILGTVYFIPAKKERWVYVLDPLLDVQTIPDAVWHRFVDRASQIRTLRAARSWMPPELVREIKFQLRRRGINDIFPKLEEVMVDVPYMTTSWPAFELIRGTAPLLQAVTLSRHSPVGHIAPVPDWAIYNQVSAAVESTIRENRTYFERGVFDHLTRLDILVNSHAQQELEFLEACPNLKTLCLYQDHVIAWTTSRAPTPEATLPTVEEVRIFWTGTNIPMDDYSPGSDSILTNLHFPRLRKLVLRARPIHTTSILRDALNESTTLESADVLVHHPQDMERNINTLLDHEHLRALTIVMEVDRVVKPMPTERVEEFVRGRRQLAEFKVIVPERIGLRALSSQYY